VYWLSSRSTCCTGGQVDDDTGNMFLRFVNWMSIKTKPFAFNFHVLNNNAFPVKLFLLLIIGCFHFSFYNPLVYTAGFKKIRYFVRPAKIRVLLLLKINYVITVQSDRKM
jgi:hypothetical protein